VLRKSRGGIYISYQNQISTLSGHKYSCYDKSTLDQLLRRLRFAFVVQNIKRRRRRNMDATERPVLCGKGQNIQFNSCGHV